MLDELKGYVGTLRVTLGIILGCGMIHTGIAQPNHLFKKLTNRDGLSHNTVFDIEQDSSGILWVGTRQGLNKYDSYSFETYSKEEFPGLSGDVCRSVIITSNFSMYIGGAGGLSYYDRKKNRFKEILDRGSSLPMVYDIIEGNNDEIIIGTQIGCFVYNTNTDSLSGFTELSGLVVYSIAKLNEEQFFIGTHNGLYRVDRTGLILEHYTSASNPELTSNLIMKVFVDHQGSVWLGTEDSGLWRFRLEDGTFEAIQLSQEDVTGSEFIRAIVEDPRGNIWVGTEAGLFIYDPAIRKSDHIPQALESSEQYLNDNSVYEIFLSKEEIMWLGTWFGGINYTKLDDKKPFNHFQPGNDLNELKGKAINQMMQRSGQLWVATQDGGACVIDIASKTILQYYQYDRNNGLSSNNIHAVSEDRDGNVWFGHFRTGLDRLTPATGQFTNIYPNPDKKNNAKYNSINDMYLDRSGRLWVGTRANILIYDYEGEVFVPFKPEIFDGLVCFDILEDRKKRIWFTTRWNGVYMWDPVSDAVTHYLAGSENARGLSSNRVISAMEDTKGKIWFGTIGGGVNIFHTELDSFFVVSKKQGMADYTVYGILEDNKEDIWMSTNQGLSRYDPDTKKLINYKGEDGLSQIQFNYGSYLIDSAGTLYFGSIEGLTYFDPLSITDNTHRPNVVLTDFKVFNQSVPVTNEGILTQIIGETSNVILEFDQNVFTIDFVGINYFTRGDNHYYYYLDGIESGWNNAGDRTSVTYTNLSPGDYTFYVRAVSNDGYESTNIRSLQITVLRPWYQSDLAIIVYVMLLASALYIARKFIIQREKERNAIELDKLEHSRVQQLNQQRINFFTFISHEFKTPLTIILASIEELHSRISINNEISTQFDRVQRSARRLGHLIGQLMEFRKIETRHAKLILRKGDVVDYFTRICQAFESLALSRELSFYIKSSPDSYQCWFDSDKLEKIVSNLVSNAVKYTPSGELIECELKIVPENSTEFLQIRIYNTGTEIDEKELNRVFNQFEVGTSDPARLEYGSGIGLALVRSLVDYMQGTLHAESIGTNTSFTVTLPTQYNRAANVELSFDEIDTDQIINLEHLEYFTSPDLEMELGEKSGELGQYHLLIVEDTLDLAEVLLQHFSPHYQVSFAKNALEALSMLQSEEPDLIISDIMMPEMSGLEFCKKVKADPATSHIAVILLTAKVTHEDKILGLESGAEAYVAKPFDFRELDLHVKHFINRRHKLKEQLVTDGHPDLDLAQLNIKDKKFIEQATSIIESNLENESFGMDDLANELGMSKTLVYLKHKKLMLMSAKEYLQLLRFKKAIQLMKGQEFSVAEIAYKVGFSDPNYFSRAFKKVYGKAPTEYRDDLLNMLSVGS